MRLKRKDNNHIYSIDLLRGIAALMVCFYHFAAGNKDFLSDDNFLKILSKHGHYGVEIFFIISGFILPFSLNRSNYQLKNYVSFLYKRVIRIEPAYLINVLLVIILAYVSTLSPYYRGEPFSVDWTTVGLHFAYLVPYFDKEWLNPVYWTLAIEFQFYLFIALVFPFLQKTNRNNVIAILFTLLLLTFLPLDRDFLPHHLPYFVVGLSLYFSSNKTLNLKSLILILATAAGVAFYQNGYIPVFIIISTPLIIVYVNSIPRLFKWLGTISYSLYLIHVPLGARILNISENFIKNESLRMGIILAVIAFCCLSAYVYYIIIEKKSIAASKRIKYKR